MLKSYSHASNLPPNTSVGCRRKVYLTSNACLHVCIHITNTQTCLILYFLTFLCAFCTFCAIPFISVWLTGIVNTSSPLLGFCSIFTFLIERCGGLCRFFVMHMSTSCRLTLFYLQESCFKCFVSFAFCACAKSHTWCFFLVLWTDDSQTLETLCDSPCHYEYLYQCIFLEVFTMLCVLKQN